jgi:predicted NUDIX family NTP pyrophosphohydrolase
MAKENIAAGLLMCKITDDELHYFLVHPGGPFFKNKQEGVWSIPKGIPEPGETDLLSVAKREFEEETGIKPTGEFHSLGFVQQKAGKIVHAWTFIGEWNPVDKIKSNTFSLEWPPKSGKFQLFPEMDEARWMSFDEAVAMINPAQVALLARAREMYLK